MVGEKDWAIAENANRRESVKKEDGLTWIKKEIGRDRERERDLDQGEKSIMRQMEKVEPWSIREPERISNTD